LKALILLLVVLVIVGAVWAATVRNRARASHSREVPRRKGLMTGREQAMYKRLVTVLPHHVVLAQVSFSALLTARHKAVRNTFDRKVADFVICSKAMEVLAVVELDDASHRDKGAADAARDAMLTGAGYAVLRYAHVPDAEQLLRDVPVPAAQPVAQTRAAALR